MRRFFPKRELSEIYMAVATRALAFSLINLFVPLYLYLELGFSFEMIVYFYITYSAVFAIATPFAAKLTSRIGLKHAILLSCPIYITFYLLLYGMKVMTIPVLVVPALFGLASSIFWIAFHVEFAKVSDSGKRGSEYGKQVGYSSIAILCGPFIGGLLIDSVGFTVVFIIASILLVSSATFLFFSGERHEPAAMSFRHIFSKRNMKNNLAFVGLGVHNIAAGVLWPLFIFFILKTYTSLGLMGSLAGAATVLITLLVGKLSDRHNKRHILRFGATLYSVSWFIRHLVETVMQVFGISMFASMVHTIVNVPSHALICDEFQENMVERFVFREIALCVGRILVLLIFLFTGKFIFAFLAAGFSGFAFWLF